MASAAPMPDVGDEWQGRAACRPEVWSDPDIFYPPRARTSAGQSRADNEAKRAAIIAEAKSVCYGVPGIRPECPVRRECRLYADVTHQTEGVWGGQTPEERGVRELR